MRYFENPVILTDAHGRPIPKPRRVDYASDADYVRAFHTYKDKVTNAANAGFDAGLRKGMRQNARRGKGEMTDTNLFALHKVLEQNGGVVPAKIDSVDYPHLRRALSNGLLEQNTDGSFRLSPKGESELSAWRARRGLRDNPDASTALVTGALVLAAVGITWLMFREKPGEEKPAPAPPAPLPPAPEPPPIVVVVPVSCIVNLVRFKQWLTTKGFEGVWLDNVQTTPPILSVLKMEHPTLAAIPFDKIAVATNNGEKIWYYQADGEPYTTLKIHQQLCNFIAQVTSSPCVVVKAKFEAWALSNGKIGVWWPDVTVPPPNAATVKASVPEPLFTQLQTVQAQNITVATNGGDSIWYFDNAGEPYTNAQLHQQLCAWIKVNP